jgi:hypothetical protein
MLVVSIENACLGCGTISDSMEERYCSDCKIRIKHDEPRDEFGRFMHWIMSRDFAYLLPSDIEILNNNPNSTIRMNETENQTVKSLWRLYNSL